MSAASYKSTKLPIQVLTNFVHKSARVKALSFHATLPWILVGYHSGLIEILDYYYGAEIQRYEKHQGPVRSVSFHPTQHLFVSGGDDTLIYLWNYKERRCTVTLAGHNDYVRTVEFHSEYPWIVSASDDLTVRIWNWQSQRQLVVLFGHAHYVMCARFHPFEDYVVSASLDSTIRVWDISSLRKMSVIPPNEYSLMNPLSSSLMLSGDSAFNIKFILGSFEAVNWVCCHPTSPLLVTAGDDRNLKVWRCTDMHAWELDTMSGHTNNVPCCTFSSNAEYLISAGEDRTLRIWDFATRTLIHTMRNEKDRFWVTVIHPMNNLIAAGHDSGLVIFKLQKERVPMFIPPLFAAVYYLRQHRHFMHYSALHNMETSIANLRPNVMMRPSAIALNNAATHLVVAYEAMNAKAYKSPPASSQPLFEIYQVPKKPPTTTQVTSVASVAPLTSGVGAYPIFIDTNRAAFVSPAKGTPYVIEISDASTPPQPVAVTSEYAENVTAMFASARPNQAFIQTGETFRLFDFGLLASVATLNDNLPGAETRIKDIVVDRKNESYIAIVYRKTISIARVAEPAIKVLSTFSEATIIKSVVWVDDQVLIYATRTHILFALPNGERGILRSFNQTAYLFTLIPPKHAAGGGGPSQEQPARRKSNLAQTASDTSPNMAAAATSSEPESSKINTVAFRRTQHKIFYFDRNQTLRMLYVSMAPVTLRKHIAKNQIAEAKALLETCHLLKMPSITEYLVKSGHSELALLVTEDPAARFELALQQDDVRLAWSSFKKMDQYRPDFARRLATVAMRHMEFGMAEFLLKQTDRSRLAMIYLITGQRDKLQAMAAQAIADNDAAAVMHLALFLQDVPMQIEWLKMQGWDTLSSALLDLSEGRPKPDPFAGHAEILAPTSFEVESLYDDEDANNNVLEAIPAIQDTPAGPMAVALSSPDATRDAIIAAIGRRLGDRPVRSNLEKVVLPLLDDLIASRKTSADRPVELLAQRLTKVVAAANEAFTAGRFPSATTHFREALQVSVMQDLPPDPKYKEYLLCMRLDAGRRALPATNSERWKFLVCAFADRRLSPLHRVMTWRLASTILFKAKVFPEARALAKQILDSPIARDDHRVTAEQILRSGHGTDPKSAKLMRRRALVCAQTLNEINSAEGAVVSCPYCGSLYSASAVSDQTCVICELAIVSAK